MFDTPSSNQEQSRDLSFWQGIFMPWFICLLASVFYLYDFIMRVTPSVMIHNLMGAFNVSALKIGLLSACYYYVYTPLQLPSGAIIDKYSRRWILAGSSLVCALGGFLFATTNNLTVACIGRAMMGLGSAFAFVGALKLASLWLPKRRFALFSSLTTALGTIGAITTDFVLSHSVHALGWRHTVIITSWIGVALTIVIIAFVRDRPHWLPRLPSEMRTWKHILLNFLGLFRSIRIWINGLVGAFMFLPISVFASLWGVAFLRERFHLTAIDAARTTSLIFIGCSIGLPFFGWWSDKIQRRRTPILIGMILVFILSTVIIYTPNLPKGLLFTLLFALGFFVAPQALVFAVAKELSPPRSTGISTAATNFLVTMGAAVFQPLIGYLLDKNWNHTYHANGIPLYSTGDFQHAFMILILVLLIAVVMTFFIPETEGKMIHPKAKKFQRLISENRSPPPVRPL